MLYAVYFRWCWALYRNKREAMKQARTNAKMGTFVEVWSHVDVPEISAWDWPTFVIGATRIYPAQ